MGTEMNWKAVARRDPAAEALIASASQVAVYRFQPDTHQWVAHLPPSSSLHLPPHGRLQVKTEVEGPMHVYKR